VTDIVATADQAEIIRRSTFPIVLRDASGKVIGKVVRWPDEHFTAEELAESKRRAGQPGRRYTTAEVLAHLRSLAPE
jgi:hypothetical protein